MSLKTGAGRYRHTVDIYRKSTSQNAMGEPDGAPILIRESVPCSITTLQGREAEIARTVMPEATFKVECNHNPAKPVTTDCFLSGGYLGARKLWIGFVNDIDNRGVKLTLTCGEEVANGIS